jgi:hypothetical protein
MAPRQIQENPGTKFIMSKVLTTRSHPEAPRFFQWGEGSPLDALREGDPSLCLKNGSAQDDPNGGA